VEKASPAKLGRSPKLKAVRSTAAQPFSQLLNPEKILWMGQGSRECALLLKTNLLSAALPFAIQFSKPSRFSLTIYLSG
jgi:hypothetical protein